MNKCFCVKCGKQMEKAVIEGRERFVCKSCLWILYENPLPVVVAICYDQKKQLLLIKRGIEPNKGKWSVPGGFLEQGETPEQGCLRELQEETGVTGKVKQNIGTGHCKSQMYGDIVFLYYAVEADTEDIIISEEVMEACFVDRKEISRIYSDMHKRFIALFYDKLLKGSL